VNELSPMGNLDH